jgi:hypothetical protein
MSIRAEQAPPASVVAAVLFGDADAVSETLAAARGQVYEPSRLVLVGGDGSGRSLAEESGVQWFGSIESGSVPRPDALRALMIDAERAGAALAGSKVLDKEDPEKLVSVGLATDVFDVPFGGLDPGEMDAGQYDVVRDVAAIDGVSFLVRRDLALGLGGFDKAMAPRAAAVDLSQRARLRAARVVVAPSSVVEYSPAEGRGRAWREEASRIRAMLKAYSLLTLWWALPLTFFIGLLEAIVAPFVGRWTLFNWIRAWLWNVVNLPMTLWRRRSARKGDVIGDVEFYRYQVRGSVTLRALGDQIGSLSSRLALEERSNLTDLGRGLRRPAFMAGLVAAVFCVVATRSVWSGGFPAVGYSLPLPASGSDAVSAYAGGWNPGGFGSAEPLAPLIGFAGALQTILFDNAGLATAVLILGSFLLGIWGTVRLLRLWDVGPVSGIIAGIALVAGPATRGLAADTGVGPLLALGALPWALHLLLLRWPVTWRGRVGRVAHTAWVTGVLAVLAPQLLIVPAGAVVLWAALNATDRSAWRAAAAALVAALLAVPMLLPWLDAVDLKSWLNDGFAFWDPGLVLATALGLAFIATVVSAPGRLAMLAAWGGVLVAAGGVLARSGDWTDTIGDIVSLQSSPGREVEHLGIAVIALGTAIVVGSASEAVTRVVEVTGWRRMVAGVGAVSAAVVAASALLVVVPGRAGLPADLLEDRIGFTEAADGDPASSRILLIGPEDAIPGESRTVRGAAFRVVSAPVPEMWEAWLPEERAVDASLEADLDAMIEGSTFRAGEVLAPYGIRWVISLGESPLEGVFAGQLDLVPLGTRAGAAFTVEGDPPVRAVADDGTEWARTSAGYDGDSGAGRVFLAETGDPRWEPGGEVSGWGTSVATVDGTARFDPIEERRRQAITAAGFLGLLMIVAWWGRRRS